MQHVSTLGFPSLCESGLPDGAGGGDSGLLLMPSASQEVGAGVRLDDNLLYELAGLVDAGGAGVGGSDSLPTPRLPGGVPAATADSYVPHTGGTEPTLPASDAEIMQAKAESIVAKLDEAHDLKEQNPYRGLGFNDLIQRISLTTNPQVYQRKVSPQKATQGTVAEQLVAVADCENERHMFRMRRMQEMYEARIEEMRVEHSREVASLKDDTLRKITHLEDEYQVRIDRSKANLKGQTEVLAREGMQSQLESERAKDQLSLLNEDLTCLKKLLYFWKKKNAILKQHFDQNERELEMAREKLKDYQQIHQMDAYKVHRFCGQLREKEMKSKWRADAVERQLQELQQSFSQFREERQLLLDAPEGYASAAGAAAAPTSMSKLNMHVDPASVDAYYMMLDSVNAARFELSRRCKSILGMQTEAGSERRGAEVRAEGGAAGNDITALTDGLHLRDNQIDVLLTAVEFRDNAMEGLQKDIGECTKVIGELRQGRAAGTDAEGLARENAALLQQVNDVKDIMYSMQKQLQEERAEMARERCARADWEMREAKDIREREASMAQQLREKDMEIIRLRNRLQSNGTAGTGASAETELRVIRTDQENNELREELETAEGERARLKLYIASLSSRLEQTLTQLSNRTKQIKQYETLASEIALSPRIPETVARAHSASPQMAR